MAFLAVIVGAGLLAYHQLKINDKSVYPDKGIEDIVNMPQEDLPEQEKMVDKELPFVISSSIYEDPVRIVVTVNTTDEASINKVKAFDTVGGVIEIIYKENGIMDKEEMYE